MKTILSFYDYSGSWSQPYVDAGYNVLRFDLQKDSSQDVRLLKKEFNNVYGILAAPPCTHFAVSGNRYRAKEKLMDGSGHFQSKYDENIQESLSLVDAVMRAVIIYQPVFWAIENPVGTLSRYIGPAKFKFNPCEFAGYIENPGKEAYTKKTLLWGQFNDPIKKPVEPVLGSVLWKNYGGKSQRTKNARSKTPEGFAKAFFLSNK